PQLDLSLRIGRGDEVAALVVLVLDGAAVDVVDAAQARAGAPGVAAAVVRERPRVRAEPPRGDVLDRVFDGQAERVATPARADAAGELAPRLEAAGLALELGGPGALAGLEAGDGARRVAGDLDERAERGAQATALAVRAEGLRDP